MNQAQSEEKVRVADTEDEPDDWYVKEVATFVSVNFLTRGNRKGQENRRNWLRRYELELCSFRSDQDG